MVMINDDHDMLPLAQTKMEPRPPLPLVTWSKFNSHDNDDDADYEDDDDGDDDDHADDDVGDGGGGVGVEIALYILLAEQFWWLGHFGKCSRCSFVVKLIPCCD